MRYVYNFLLETIRSVEQLEFFAKPGAAFVRSLSNLYNPNSFEQKSVRD